MSPPAGFRSQWVDVDGLRVHALHGLFVESARVRGRERAVLVPGLVTAGRSMVRLAVELGRCGVSCMIVDPVGFGYSDRPAAALGVRRRAALLAGWLEASQQAPAWLVGNSFGCQLAAAVAAARPDLVSRVALASPTTSPRLRHALRWLAAGPAERPAERLTAGAGKRRWRARALSRAHDALGVDPGSADRHRRLPRST